MPEPELWTTDEAGAIVVIPSTGPDPELEAMRIILVNMARLDQAARARVIRYLTERYA